jgi:hypothetical protein
LPRILFMILCSVGGAAAWVMFHPIALPAPHTLNAQDDDWHLSGRSKPDTKALIGTIERGQLWGATGMPAPVAEKPLTAPDWRIVGIVSAGAESYAMLEVDGQPLQQIKTGANLPGGAKIVNMSADHICILLNGKKRMLKTYKE